MGLLDALSNKPDPEPHWSAGCKVGHTLLSLEDDNEREVFMDALKDKGWTNPALSRALMKEGYDIPSHTLSTHRRAKCRCDSLGVGVNS